MGKYVRKGSKCNLTMCVFVYDFFNMDKERE